jgi:hypothetical protein
MVEWMDGFIKLPLRLEAIVDAIDAFSDYNRSHTIEIN